MRHLEGTPAQFQSAKIIKDFKLAVEPFKLMKAEKLQLLNHRPTTAVEIQLMVEENEERLTEEQLDELINVVKTILPGVAPV